MSRRKIRFGLAITEGPNAGLRCAGWRVWTGRDDIYITTSNLGGIWKASLHGEETWRLAPTTEHIGSLRVPRIDDRPSHTIEFPVVPFDPAGVRRTFAIGVPRVGLMPEAPPDRREIEITVEDDWEQIAVATVWTTKPSVGLPDHAGAVIGEPLELANGDTVWVSHHVERHGPTLPEPQPAGRMIALLYPPRDEVPCPGFLVKGVNIVYSGNG